MSVHEDELSSAASRDGFKRMWIREDQLSRFTNHGFEKVKQDSKKAPIVELDDPCGNNGKPGRIFLVEAPDKINEKFQRDHNGGKLLEMQKRALGIGLSKEEKAERARKNRIRREADPDRAMSGEQTDMQDISMKIKG